MTAYAAAIRRAILAVARIHRDLGIQAQATKEDGRVNVFETVARLGLPLIFRPLDGLLGAYLHEPTPGVLVTTKRPLSVQRFTVAHELGHHQLGHKPSLDDENVLRRAPFVAGPGEELQELEANTFAAAFLLPRWLVQWHCARHGWRGESLQRPEVVYQLALRAGTSYEATCWTLYRYRMLERARARQLASISPKTIKQNLLGTIEPENFYGDVWMLTQSDSGSRIEGGPSDHFVMRLPEHSNSGYLWRVESLDGEGFSVVEDIRESTDGEERIGGVVTRRITAQSRRKQAGEVRLTERRPWQPSQALSTFAVRYDLTGAEAEGWSRAERRHRLEAA